MQPPNLRLLKPSTGPLLAILAMAGTGLGCDSTEPQPAPRIVWESAGEGWGIPAFDENQVFFLGRNHDLIAVNKTTGARTWRSVMGAGSSVTYGINVVTAGSLVIAGDAGIHAFEKSTGVAAWKYFGPAGKNPGAFDIATDGSRVYAGSTNGSVTALDATTGGELWTTDIAGTTSALVIPTLASTGLFACLRRTTTGRTTGGIVALDPATGAVRWTFEFPQKLPAEQGGCYLHVVVAGDLVIGATFDGFIYAVDAQTGAERWSVAQITGTPTDYGSPQFDLRPLAVSGDVVAAGSTTGFIVALRLTDGSEKWRATANRGAVVDHMTADQTGIYAFHAGRIAAFDASDGNRRFMVGDPTPTTEPLFVYAPAVDTDLLFIGGFAGLYALRKA